MAAMSPTVGRKEGYKMAAEWTRSNVHVQRVSLHRQQALVGGRVAADLHDAEMWS